MVELLKFDDEMCVYDCLEGFKCYRFLNFFILIYEQIEFWLLLNDTVFLYDG